MSTEGWSFGAGLPIGNAAWVGEWRLRKAASELGGAAGGEGGRRGGLRVAMRILRVRWRIVYTGWAETRRAVGTRQSRASLAGCNLEGGECGLSRPRLRLAVSSVLCRYEENNDVIGLVRDRITKLAVCRARDRAVRHVRVAAGVR